jgi:CBS-domain-containing membrane protein
LVVDEDGGCCGIVSQADVARNAPRRQIAELLEEVSQPALV